MGRPFQRGPDERRGRGPAKGAPNAGRPPDEHREFCRSLISDPDCEREVKAILTDRDHPAFKAMWAEVARRGYGMPAQPHTGADGEGPIAHRVEVTRRIVRPEDRAA